jgi:hypothetical protein
LVTSRIKVVLLLDDQPVPIDSEAVGNPKGDAERGEEHLG